MRHLVVCVLTALFLIQPAPAQTRPAAAQSSVIETWEYGQLTFVGLTDPPIGPSWLSTDTAAIKVLNTIAAEQSKFGRAGDVTLVRLLNVLGSRGWELVGMPMGSGNYLFKRRTARARS